MKEWTEKNLNIPDTSL